MAARKMILFLFCLLFICIAAFSQTDSQQKVLSKLTVEKIMRDPKWIGTSPNRINWSEDGQLIYFTWNPENA